MKKETALLQPPGGFADQTQIPVGRDPFLQRDELAARGGDGDFPGDLEDGRSLVDFIEHRDIEHPGAGLDATRNI